MKLCMATDRRMEHGEGDGVKLRCLYRISMQLQKLIK